jgi:hypothetical protein
MANEANISQQHRRRLSRIGVALALANDVKQKKRSELDEYLKECVSTLCGGGDD